MSFGFQAQSVEFEKDNFPGKKDELRAARKQLEIGMEFYVSGRREFDDYKKFYYGEHKYLPVSAYDYQKIGITFFRQALTPLTDANKFNPIRVYPSPSAFVRLRRDKSVVQLRFSS